MRFNEGSALRRHYKQGVRVARTIPRIVRARSATKLLTRRSRLYLLADCRWPNNRNRSCRRRYARSDISPQYRRRARERRGAVHSGLRSTNTPLRAHYEHGKDDADTLQCTASYPRAKFFLVEKSRNPGIFFAQPLENQVIPPFAWGKPFAHILIIPCSQCFPTAHSLPLSRKGVALPAARRYKRSAKRCETAVAAVSSHAGPTVPP